MDGIAQDIGEVARCPLSCKDSPQATWLGQFGVWISSDVFLGLCEHQFWYPESSQVTCQAVLFSM